MFIHDSVYGDEKIEEPILIELITSPSMQRLKKISQFGLPDRFYNIDGFSRFDHSVGVTILLRRLGAEEEEQIAGLLHDVSHTAFSHIVDWLQGDTTTEDSQDLYHEERLKKSELPAILKKHGYQLKNITDYHRFPLLEQEIPDLCADRVDYALREFEPVLAHQLFSELTVADNKIAFSNQRAARLFAERFLRAQMEHWGGFEAISRYKIFARVLREALKEKIIKISDLLVDDDHVLAKLEACDNSWIQSVLKQLAKKSLADLPKEEKPTPKKFRFVDPLFLDEGKLQRLSAVDAEFKKILESTREENNRGLQSVDPKKI